MKTIQMSCDYSFRAAARIFVQYCEGVTYRRVPEAAARAILAAEAGRVVEPATDD